MVHFLCATISISKERLDLYGFIKRHKKKGKNTELKGKCNPGIPLWVVHISLICLQ